MKLTPEKLTAFCAALAETCNVGKACKAIDVSRYTAYKWRKDMPKFAEAWDDAMKAGLLALEDEAHRRAFEGVREPLVHQGQMTYEYERDDRGRIIYDEEVEVNGEERTVIRTPRLKLDENGEPMVSTVRKYSDTLAIFLLKAHAPEKYRENSKMELSGPNNGPIQMDSTTRSARLATLVAKLKARAEGGPEPTPEDWSDLA